MPTVPYRVGIIGTGRVASTFEDTSPVHPASLAGAFAALPNARLTAACNRGLTKLRAFGERWGVTSLYQDYREMLAREALDIVVVATHPPEHPEMVIAAAEAGVRGIFCEKPMALSLAECDAMLAACERAGTLLLINTTRRWFGQFETARRLIQNEGLGPLLHVVGHCQGAKPTPDWVAETEGPLLHDAVHVLDAMRFFAGDAARVLGTARRRARTDLRVEDTSHCLIEFHNGVDGVLIVNELSEYERMDLELQCERGVIRFGFVVGAFGTGLWVSQPEEFEPGNWWELAPGEMPPAEWDEPPMLMAARDLVQCLDSGLQPRSTGRDGRAAVELIMAIYESELRGNQWVDLPLQRGERMLDILRERGRF